ncbi:hypothetical protein EV182_002955, partial [Spiromyces aspiralis]
DLYFERQPAKFLLSATRINHIEHNRDPEKSSLINAIVNNGSLVKTSKKPVGFELRLPDYGCGGEAGTKDGGHTALLNFFSVRGKYSQSIGEGGGLTLVDMPGYGFKSREEWGDFIINYFRNRHQLRRVYLLIEAKVGQLKATDIQLLEMLEQDTVAAQVGSVLVLECDATTTNGLPGDICTRVSVIRYPMLYQPLTWTMHTRTQIVLTKTDKVKDAAQLAEIKQRVHADAWKYAPTVVSAEVLAGSSKTKAGIQEIRRSILMSCGIIAPIRCSDK